jgi:hypothetical protein
LQRYTCKDYHQIISGGEFNQIITDTQNVFNSYFGSINDEDQNFAVQQGLTISVTKVLKRV